MTTIDYDSKKLPGQNMPELAESNQVDQQLPGTMDRSRRERKHSDPQIGVCADGQPARFMFSAEFFFIQM